VLLVVATVVEITVVDVIAVVEVVVMFEVVTDVDVGLEVVFVAGVDVVVELPQEAKTKVTTIKQANNIQITPFFIYPPFFYFPSKAQIT
jgi:hypothetical protein